MIKLSKDLTLPLDVAGEAIAILATRGAGKSFTSAVLIEELYRSHVQTVVIDPTGVYWGLRSDAKGKGDGLPIIVLGGEHGDVPLQETAGKLIADMIVDTSQTVILDLSDFDSDAAQCRFMTDFAERLYRRKARSRTTLHLVVDEADEFAPQQPQAKEARMVGAMAKLVRRGRSRGIGMTMITQRSAALNKNLLDLVDTLLLMRMLGPRDREAAAGWIKHNKLSDEMGVLDSLPSLPTGTAWVWSPLRNVLEKAAVRRIETFDSYVTPKPGQVRVEPKALAKVDIDKLGEQIKATAEKAKADDPVALRKRIAELEWKKAEPPGHSKADLNAEYTRGRCEGFDAGLLTFFNKINGPLKTLESNAANLLALATGAMTDTDAVIKNALLKGPRTENPGTGSTPTRPQQQTRVAATSASTARQIDGAGSTTLQKAERKVLTALAQYPAGRTIVQVAVLTGYAAGGGGFRNAIGAMRSREFIAGSSDNLFITPEGVSALGEYQALPTGAALRQYWYGQLGKAERSSLEVLADAYPNPCAIEDVAAAAGYQHGGGGFRNAIGRLRTLELITGKSNALKASENLF